jgi:hypothetical protein
VRRAGTAVAGGWMMAAAGTSVAGLDDGGGGDCGVWAR